MLGQRQGWSVRCLLPSTPVELTSKSQRFQKRSSFQNRHVRQSTLPTQPLSRLNMGPFRWPGSTPQRRPLYIPDKPSAPWGSFTGSNNRETAAIAVSSSGGMQQGRELGAVSLTKLFTPMVDGFTKRHLLWQVLLPRPPTWSPVMAYTVPLGSRMHVWSWTPPAVHLSNGTLIQTFSFYQPLPSVPRSSCRHMGVSLH